MGKNYKSVLTPSQQVEMKLFLRTLLWAGNKALAEGVKPNVELFIRARQGLPVTAEERRIRHRGFQEDYHRRKREKGRLDE